MYRGAALSFGLIYGPVGVDLFCTVVCSLMREARMTGAPPYLKDHYWDDLCLFHLIYFALHIFHIWNLLLCIDESWWNMPFKETRLGDGVADDAVAMLLPLWLHAAALWRTQFEYILWGHTMHEWFINIHYKTWIPQGRFTNMILTPSKQWSVCDNDLKRLKWCHLKSDI